MNHSKAIFILKALIANPWRSPISLLFSTLLSILLLSSCVSVSLGPKPASRSKDVHFDEPSSPFKQLEETKADAAWFNSKNGNSISFLSSCNDPSDPAIESITRELFADLTDLKTIEQSLINFNGRIALVSEVEGQVDGVSTRIRATVFKKNNCLYTLSYIGVPKTFEQDRHFFEAFLRSFEAP